MFQSFNEAILLKPYYIQCIIVFVLTLSLGVLFYFTFIEEKISSLQFQRRENKKLEQVLLLEKNRYEKWLDPKLQKSYYQEERYLNLPSQYQQEAGLLKQLTELFKKKNLFLSKVMIKESKEKSDYRNLWIHVNLSGHYWDLVKVYFEMMQAPYLATIESFHLQKYENKNEGEKIYAEMVIKVFIFK